MKIDDLLGRISTMFPEKLQESFDNTGSQIVSGDEDLSNILVSLDINNQTVDKAKELNCNLIVTHHPLIFRPLKEIQQSHYRQKLVFKLIQEGISLYSIHTNLDKHYWRKPAEALGLLNISPLFPEEQESELSIGAAGTLPKTITLPALLEKVQKSFTSDYLHHSKENGNKIHTVAILNGAGGSMIYPLLESRKYDCIITGDLGYHPAYEAAEAGVVIIDAGHFHTEKLFCNFLQNDIRECLTEDRNKHQIFINPDEVNPLYLYS